MKSQNKKAAVLEKESQDSFDAVSQKRGPGRPRKIVQPLPPIEEEKTVENVVEETESEDLSEEEANAMVERAEQRKAEVQKKKEALVDQQEWDLNDPVIPEDMKDRIWIAVFKCPLGHKTKATNRQIETGVLCGTCRLAGKQTQADVMPQFLENNSRKNDETAKRKAAARGGI